MEARTGLHNTGDNTVGWSATGHDRIASQGAASQGAASEGAASQGAASQGANPQGQAAPEQPGRPDIDPAKLARDWITLWQSELAAMAADPELHAAWQTMMAIWAGTMAAIVRGMPTKSAYDRTRGHAGAASPGTADAPRPSPAAAAPDARDVEIDRLARHVAALEQRLADLGLGGDPAVTPKRRAGRKPRK